jgi:hypothetical protein
VKPAPAAARDRAAREHRAALAAALAQLARLDEVRWAAPWASGKWTRAEVAEHLALTYEAVLHELETGVAMRPRVGAGMQRLLRWVLLPHILFHRSIPLRARAPRETRPAEAFSAPARTEATERLRALGERAEARLLAAAADGGRPVHHPYFGALPPHRALRFLAAHLEHHTRQLSA